MTRLRGRKLLLAGCLVPALALIASGCSGQSYVRISSQTSAQLNQIGNVQLSTTICSNNGNACGPVNVTNQTVTLKIGYVVPNASTPPTTFSTVSGRALTFSQDSTYTPAQAGVTVPAGSKWVGYKSGSFTYNGASESIQVKPEFKLTQGADGSPYSGGFPYSVTTQESDGSGLSNPSTASGSQATNDLGVLHTDNSAPAGNNATLRFVFRYAGASGVGPFTVGAFGNVTGATLTPSVSSFTPAPGSDTPVVVRLRVPANTSPGSYSIVAYAQIAGQTRAGVAHLTVTAPAPEVKQVAAGYDHTCALLHNGSVRCWGNNSLGQLGLGNTTDIGMTPDRLPDTVPPVDLGPGRTAIQLSSGFDDTCALLDNHKVLCWGSGEGGELGQPDSSGMPDHNIGDNETPGSLGTVNLGGGHTAVQVTSGTSYNCALLDDGSVKCWGAGTNGELGYGNTSQVEDPSTVAPVDLGPGRTAVQIAAGSDHTCAILDTGAVMCWGSNYVGKDGYGYNQNVDPAIGDDESPASVGTVDLGGHTALQVTAGDNHTCVLRDDHQVVCWGTDFRGIGGYPNGNDAYSPPANPIDFGAHTVQQIDGGADSNCAVLDDQTVRCWGFADDGRLGYGNLNDVGDNETPGSVGPVQLGAAASQVSVGRFHSCAVLITGDVRCWGNGQLVGYGNASNNIGDNETPDTAGPVALTD